MAVEIILRSNLHLSMGPGRDRTLSPLYLQSDMHLQSDTLSSALCGPLKVLSPEMNVSSGVSKVNIIYIRQKRFLFPVTLTTLIFLGLLFGNVLGYAVF